MATPERSEGPTQLGTEKKLLVGRVAVDSARLIVVDPMYLDAEWIRGNDAEPYAVNCFGADVEALVNALRASPGVGQVEPMSGGRWFRVHPGPGQTAEDVYGAAKRLKDDRRWAAAMTPAVHDSREAISTHLADHLAKVLPFRNGNDGWLAAFSLGADGSYPVYAVVRDTPDGPELVRIQVEITP